MTGTVLVIIQDMIQSVLAVTTERMTTATAIFMSRECKPLEGWVSGLNHLPAKKASQQWPRKFKSCTLRFVAVMA